MIFLFVAQLKVHAYQNANAYFIFDSKAFSFDYRAKKMSF